MLQKSLQLDFGTQSHKLFSQTKIQIGFGSKNQKMMTIQKPYKTGLDYKNFFQNNVPFTHCCRN